MKEPVDLTDASGRHREENTGCKVMQAQCLEVVVPVPSREADITVRKTRETLLIASRNAVMSRREETRTVTRSSLRTLIFTV